MDWVQTVPSVVAKISLKNVWGDWVDRRSLACRRVIILNDNEGRSLYSGK